MSGVIWIILNVDQLGRHTITYYLHLWYLVNYTTSHFPWGSPQNMHMAKETNLEYQKQDWLKKRKESVSDYYIY